MAINGVFMLASPAAWSRLPGWLRAQGTLTEDGRWRAVYVRVTGALILAGIGWVLYEFLLER